MGAQTGAGGLSPLCPLSLTQIVRHVTYVVRPLKF